MVKFYYSWSQPYYWRYIYTLVWQLHVPESKLDHMYTCNHLIILGTCDTHTSYGGVILRPALASLILNLTVNKL